MQPKSSSEGSRRRWYGAAGSIPLFSLSRPDRPAVRVRVADFYQYRPNFNGIGRDRKDSKYRALLAIYFYRVIVPIVADD